MSILAKQKLKSIEDLDLDKLDIGSGASDELSEHGIYFITGEIDRDSLLPIQQDIMLKHIDPSWSGDIQLFINSLGGSAIETWAFIDILDMVRMDVQTTALGYVASAAACIFAAGTKGKRRATQNATILVHQFSTAIGGNYSELVNAQRDLDREMQKDIRFWKEHSNLDEEKVVSQLLKGLDTALTPEEALELGIVDEIMTSRKVPEVKPLNAKTGPEILQTNQTLNTSKKGNRCLKSRPKHTK